MLFNSIEFLIFFPIVIMLYFVAPFKLRWVLLLISSCIFYMFFNPLYIIIMFFSILVDYFIGIAMDAENITHKKKKFYLVLSILSNLGLLFIFKYFNFFSGLFSSFTNLLGGDYPFLDLNLLLPMGISFYTFQSLSYTIDVYRGEREAEKHLGYFALYVTFFPQLVAGPIERSDRLLPQLRQKHAFSYDNMVSGLRRMLWGFFKKIIIADNLSTVVSIIFNNPHSFDGFTLLVGILFFNIQMYCDFSGYSDIAIGSARVMGINLLENFRRPYFAHSIAEFWKRWHISLTTWFKDYLYIPLGGSRGSRAKRNLNVFLVFLISGLWHGANLTYVAWGVIHALFQFFGEITYKYRVSMYSALGIPENSKVKRVFQIAITFMLVCFAGTIFRANNLSDAYYICTHLIDIHSVINLKQCLTNLGLSSMNVLLIYLALFATFIVFVKQLLEELKLDTLRAIGKYPLVLRWGVYLFLLFFIIIAGNFNSQEFVYFQF